MYENYTAIVSATGRCAFSIPELVASKASFKSVGFVCTPHWQSAKVSRVATHINVLALIFYNRLPRIQRLTPLKYIKHILYFVSVQNAFILQIYANESPWQVIHHFGKIVFNEY